MTEKRHPEIVRFEDERAERIASYATQKNFNSQSRDWMENAFRQGYVYNFHAMGRPIIQFPADMAAVRELIWEVQPDVIVETGIAHGGSVVQSAAELALLDYCDAVAAGEVLDPANPKRKVVAVDIDIRAHNLEQLEQHPMRSRMTLIEGSSIESEIINQVVTAVGDAQTVLVLLDSNHTHEHVLQELRAYAPLVSVGSYCCVFDTVIEEFPDGFFADRPWDPGNSPVTAISAYLAELESAPKANADGLTPKFEIDKGRSDKLAVTAMHGGFLKRTN